MRRRFSRQEFSSRAAPRTGFIAAGGGLRSNRSIQAGGATVSIGPHRAGLLLYLDSGTLSICQGGRQVGTLKDGLVTTKLLTFTQHLLSLVFLF